ncbi:Protein kinase domain-containing protein [Desulfoluna spongiiphila]|uniref:Protein kinase domain-containing protein n=2 Tax=Desulfoluna spongiiphila TaxID=419481 RepID=A0A1G5GGR4_9BACT|nr:Protein kinase domain-containing protein [Desulfoluna spongiiphila]
MAGRLVTDTSDFMSIDIGDRVAVGGREYRVTGNAREGRFGVEDPKMWVKWVVDEATGERKVMKLVFFETFVTSLGGVKIRCFRDPVKEGKILELVKDHPYFMQGVEYNDNRDNSVRIIEVVRGKNFYFYIEGLHMPHQTYFEEVLPGILKGLVKAFEALRYLHVNGFRHGDVRNDHIIIDNESGNYTWIDFDYDYQATENPFGLDIFGMGNILLYAIGKGFHTLHMIKYDTRTYGDLFDSLVATDLSILDGNRVMNLRKVYPYIPKSLNNILLHFSRGCEVYYESTDELIEDVTRCLYSVF